MKLNRNYLAHNMGEETILVPSGTADFSGVVHGNATLGVILELLKTETTEQEIIEKMCERFPSARDRIAEDVGKAISGLRRIGALDE